MHTGKFILASMLIASFGGPVFAAPWTSPAGNSGTLTYTNGQDVNGHFGEPATGEEKFVFANPIDFRAVSPGAPVTVTDTVTFNVSPPPAQKLDTVSVRIEGNYSFVADPAQIDYSALLDIDGGEYVVPISFTPPSPQTSGEGAFVGTALIDFSPDLTYASIALSATLGASSNGAATTTIQINNVQIAFTTIPEPASLGVFGGVASLLLRRRR